MAFGMWNGTVSVLLTPSGAQGEELIELARAWTREGLLSPALWVRPEAVTIEDGVPPAIGALVMARGEDDELIEDVVDLFEVLANESLQLVRLVKVRSTVLDRQSDDMQDSVANTVTAYLTYSMPLLNPALSGSTDRTELLRISLICAPTDFQLSERVEGIINDTSILVLASPEDRATPTSGDAFVRVNERFTGFVLMHLATVGGMWSGLPIGTLELFEREGSAAQAIWIPRVFVSGVLTGGLARRVAARTLGELAADSGVTGSGAQVTAAGTFVIPSDSIGEYVDSMVGAAMGLGEGALGYVQPEFESEPDRVKVSIPRQLGLFVRFAGEKILRIPHWMRLWGHDRVARGLNRRLHADDGYRSVELQLDQELDARDRMLVSSALRVRADDAAARAAESAPQLAVGRSSARLWAGLRQLTFRSLDGSGADGVQGFPLVDGTAPVFGSLSDVIPDPSDVWAHPDTRPTGFPAAITWRMAREQPELRASLQSAVDDARRALAEAQHAVEAADSAVLETREQLEQLVETLVAAGRLRLKPDGKYAAVRLSKKAAAAEADAAASGDSASDAPIPTVEDYRILETQLDSKEVALQIAVEALDGLADRLSEAEGVLGDFDEWLIPRQRSFAWRVLDRMHAAQSRAVSELETAEASGHTPPDHGELVRLRRRFHKGMITALSVIGGLTAVAIGMPPLLRWLLDSDIEDPWRRTVEMLAVFFHHEDYPEWWVLLLIGLGLLLVVVVFLLMAYYSGWSRFERRVQLAEYGVFASAGRVRALRAEVTRLKAVHRAAIDWLDMMSSAMHEPWKVRAEWLEMSDPNLDSRRLPYAMHVAQAADVPGPSSDGLKLSAAQELVKTGWRARAFADLVDESRIRLGLDPTRLNVDALDNDAPEASNNARRRLRTTMTDPEVLNRVAERRLGDVVGRLREAALYTDATEVEPIRADPLAAFRGGGRPTTVRWLEFLQRTLGTGVDVPTPLSPLVIAAHQLQQAHHQNVSSYVLAPERIAADLSKSASSSMTVKAYESEASDVFDAVVRVDIIGPVPASAIHLWSNEKRGAVAESSPVTALVCPSCGRADCPAAIPGSDAECAYSGV